MLIVNAPSILATAWSIFSALLDARTKDKISIAPPGHRTRCVLHQNIHPAQLPKFLHGTVDTPLDRLLPLIDQSVTKNRAALAKRVAADAVLQAWGGNWAEATGRGPGPAPLSAAAGGAAGSVSPAAATASDGDAFAGNDVSGDDGSDANGAQADDGAGPDDEALDDNLEGLATTKCTLTRAEVYFSQVEELRQLWRARLALEQGGKGVEEGQLGQTRISRAEAVSLFNTTSIAPGGAMAGGVDMDMHACLES
eukprot:SAG22_NODE_473_length_10069_cov_17.183250_13_plen_252_part_01